MKVKVQGSFIAGLKTVTFSHLGKDHVWLMPEELATGLELRLNAMWQFKHGILQDGKELIAMFKNVEDRDESLNNLDIHVGKRLKAFDCEEKSE
jgi:hypothetical protein